MREIAAEVTAGGPVPPRVSVPAGKVTAMPSPERAVPPMNADERSTLTGWLDFYRASLAGKCDGVDDRQARTASAARDLDGTSPLGDGVVSLRWIYAHMIGGYARHTGHADLIRERIDGVTGV